MKALLLLMACLAALGAHAETWRFAVIGDTPYSDRERRELPAMLEGIADAHPAFVVHVGDFKKSSERCSDALFRDRLDLFNASRVPLIYVPGDNEWTDCKLLTAGHYDPRERLRRLRQLFFAEPVSLGQTRIALERQSAEFPEHLRWRLGPVLLLTLNVPGPNNNRAVDQNGGDGGNGGDEFRTRNRAQIDWLNEGFAAARQEGAAGIVIAMQGNPGFKHYAAGFAHSGYRDLLETLRTQTLNFQGQVLLVHGDTHWQRVDQPLRNGPDRVANFTRLESYGYPFMGWVRVSIDSTSSRLFSFEARPLHVQRFH